MSPRLAPFVATFALGASLTGQLGARAGGDDHYRFAPEAGTERAVTLSATENGLRFAWTAPDAKWDSAFLGVAVTATSGDPSVELRAGSARVVQHLEPGASGLRWLNLTGLASALGGTTTIDVQARGLAIEPAPAQLRLFDNRLDFRRPLLILAPHPDDAEIAAFGLYASSNATIVTVTAGNAGDANYASDIPDPAEQYLFKGFLRAVDSVTVPWQGGVPPERCYNLGYFDARLATMHARPTETVSELYGPNTDVAPYRRANVSRLLPNGARANNWRNLVSDLVEVLQRVRPAVVVTPHPYLDHHSDHQFVTVALAEALARWKLDPRVLLYTNHAGRDLYPYGPAGTSLSLPPWTGPELTIEGLYARTVSPELQRRKLYALESMHDLRLSPREQAECRGSNTPERRPDYPRSGETDYFRRGPRSEELFFVSGRQGLRRLVTEFLLWREASRATAN